jgi:hypothetical protein
MFSGLIRFRCLLPSSATVKMDNGENMNNARYARPPFWKIHIIAPHVIRHTLLHPHVIWIRLLHPLEIWLVTFRIYDICKIKHILSKSMIKALTPNSEQSYKRKVKTHKYINRQNQSTRKEYLIKGEMINVQLFSRKKNPVFISRNSKVIYMYLFILFLWKSKNR